MDTLIPPRSLRELVPYLMEHPRVRITGPTPESPATVTRIETFLTASESRLWFQPEHGRMHFVPLSCNITDAALLSETGVTFDELGFTITKFNRSIRVEYF